MNNNFLYSAIFAIFSAVAVAAVSSAAWGDFPQRMLTASLFSVFSDKKEEFALTQEELVDLVKPSVVRIVQTVKFEAEIPAFGIDLDNRSVEFLSDYESLPIELETPIMGSGFVINPDGYILTNAHVVSDETIKRYVLAEIIGKVVTVEAYDMDPAKLAELGKDEQALTDLGDKVYREVAAKTNFKIDKKIVVINPTSKDESMEELLKNGFPAEIVRVNDNFSDDNRDVAVIKIEENNLPAVKLAASQEFNVGAKIYVFGFPSTAEFNRKNFIEPTFSQGVISAIKESDNKDFKILQFDAKVSQGSSGSPMIDDNGEAIGIVTYQTQGDLQSGDNFAFSIPMEVGEKFLEDVSVESIPGEYGAHFKAALVLARDKRCKKAIEVFNMAKETNSNFGADSYIDPYIENCNAMIAKGESIDNWWGEMKEWSRSVGYLGWAIIGSGMLVFAALIFLVARLGKKMKGKEKEINHLEDMMLEEAARESVQRGEMEKIIKNSTKTDSQNLHIEAGRVASGAAREIKISEEKPFVNPKPAATMSPIISAQKSNPEPEPKPQPAEPAAEPVILPADPMPAVTVDPGVAAYVKQSREAGFGDDIISGELKKSGWSDGDIQNALAA